MCFFESLNKYFFLRTLTQLTLKTLFMKTPLAILILASINLCGQIVPSEITDWKNDALGAYSIIHDDYGNSSVDGIWKYADTIAYNRGLKFTFGAITADCEIARDIEGYTNPYEYAKNVMMDQHDHEIINHSHHHNCAVARGWGDCATTGWGELPGSTSWNDNLIKSTNSINTNTGHFPRYYIYPYDQFTDAANEELESLGYIGSRSGWHIDGIHDVYHRWGYEANDVHNFFPNSAGFFRTSVQVFDDVDASQTINDQVDTLNGSIDIAIAKNQWANRELHDVGPAGWGNVQIEAYREHLNYVKQKVDLGEIWMGTVSEILTYQYQKLKTTPSSFYDASEKTINIDFSFDDSEFSISLFDYLEHLTVKSPVTIKLDISDRIGEMDFGNLKITQDDQDITDYAHLGNFLIINAYPHKGNITINEGIDTSIKEQQQSIFKVFPNPFRNELKITGERVWEILVFDAKGSIVLKGSSNRINLSVLEKGVYYLKINHSHTLQKIVKI